MTWFLFFIRMPSVSLFLCIPSGMMGKEQKEIHYCSIQFNNINLCLRSDIFTQTEKRDLSFTLFLSFYNIQILFRIKCQTCQQRKTYSIMDGANKCFVWFSSEKNIYIRHIHCSKCLDGNLSEETIEMMIFALVWNGISYFNGIVRSS